jgi:hypothetical protein
LADYKAETAADRDGGKAHSEDSKSDRRDFENEGTPISFMAALLVVFSVGPFE